MVYVSNFTTHIPEIRSNVYVLFSLKVLFVEIQGASTYRKKPVRGENKSIGGNQNTRGALA